ncbi:4-hydroxy-tetrahydrodipicolinate reductase [Pseudolysinimonas kribbensis]|uniref:4-hydroxy-tetrahydrodipicolinate reductase n=1 Tax=Pseudolysinimonas kribbensis TaxID=433641 RepID=A0ABQ6KDE7_9MICO|nr:4-hydroxy-tetrahydrodipicolinate reductase [Pseudolysinimonas kribbensis]GMA96754.1 4-hydroxy-tetrahydrodipicolinate reductase [Pseudolysinimonas kribbensis]
MAVSVAVVGATGRMGSLAVRLIEATPDLELHTALGSADPLDGIAGADLVLDFTVPAVSPDVVSAALDHGIPALVGTSGWSADRIQTVRTRVDRMPELGVVIVPNFALGSVLATRFAALAAPYFDSIEIIEAHHTGKIDSPSGTSVRTAELIGQARAEAGPVAAPHADQRARGQQVASVPIHSLRMNGILAEQTVVMGGTGEVLRITHETLGDSSYEAGIVLGIRATPAVRGVVVGLENLLELGA